MTREPLGFKHIPNYSFPTWLQVPFVLSFQCSRADSCLRLPFFFPTKSRFFAGSFTKTHDAHRPLISTAVYFITWGKTLLANCQLFCFSQHIIFWMSQKIQLEISERQGCTCLLVSPSSSSSHYCCILFFSRVDRNTSELQFKKARCNGSEYF